MEVKIPNECIEDWNNMIPDENGRFCKNCNKTVIDFTGFNDKQLYEFFRQTKGNVCGNFIPEQINRSLIINNSERGFWLSKPFFSLLVLLGLSKGLNVQNLKETTSTIQKYKLNPLSKSDNRFLNDNTIISGIVSNTNNKPLANVNVWVRDINQGTTTDSSGHFNLKFNMPAAGKAVTIVFSLTGYQYIEYSSSSFQYPLSIQMIQKSMTLRGKVCIRTEQKDKKSTFNQKIKNLFKKEIE